MTAFDICSEITALTSCRRRCCCCSPAKALIGTANFDSLSLPADVMLLLARGDRCFSGGGLMIARVGRNMGLILGRKVSSIEFVY